MVKPSEKEKPKSGPAEAQLGLFDVSPKRFRYKLPADEWADRALKTQGDIVYGVMVETGRKYHSPEAVLKAVNQAGHDFEMRHVKQALKDLDQFHRGLLIRNGWTYEIK